MICTHKKNLNMENNRSKDIKSVIKGSFHQGDLSVFDVSSVGRQCVPNCVIGALYSTLLPMAKWTSDVLDKILLCGDKLYRKIRTENDFIQIHEVGSHINEFGNTYKLSIDKEFFGHINEVRQVSVGTSLECACYLAYAGRGKHSSTCVLCVGNEKGGSASLVSM